MGIVVGYSQGPPLCRYCSTSVLVSTHYRPKLGPGRYSRWWGCARLRRLPLRPAWRPSRRSICKDRLPNEQRRTNVNQISKLSLCTNFDCPLETVTGNQSAETLALHKLALKFSALCTCNSYLCSAFLTKIGSNLQWNPGRTCTESWSSCHPPSWRQWWTCRERWRFLRRSTGNLARCKRSAQPSGRLCDDRPDQCIRSQMEIIIKN